jgi:hypothetical protein
MILFLNQFLLHFKDHKTCWASTGQLDQKRKEKEKKRKKKKERKEKKKKKKKEKKKEMKRNEK